LTKFWRFEQSEFDNKLFRLIELEFNEEKYPLPKFYNIAFLDDSLMQLFPITEDLEDLSKSFFDAEGAEKCIGSILKKSEYYFYEMIYFSNQDIPKEIKFEPNFILSDNFSLPEKIVRVLNEFRLKKYEERCYLIHRNENESPERDIQPNTIHFVRGSEHIIVRKNKEEYYCIPKKLDGVLEAINSEEDRINILTLEDGRKFITVKDFPFKMIEVTNEKICESQGIQIVKNSEIHNFL